MSLIVPAYPRSSHCNSTQKHAGQSVEKPGLTVPTSAMSDIVSHPNPCTLAQKMGLHAKEQRGQEMSREPPEGPGMEQQIKAEGEGSL